MLKRVSTAGVTCREHRKMTKKSFSSIFFKSVRSIRVQKLKIILEVETTEPLKS